MISNLLKHLPFYKSIASSLLMTFYRQFSVGKTYALISSGGRSGRLLVDKFITPLPEESDYLTTAMLRKSLIDSNTAPSTQIKILFGKGREKPSGNENSIQTTKSPLLFQTILNTLETGKNTCDHKNEELIAHITGPNNQENFKRELEQLLKVAQKKDRVFVFLNGHGAKFQGMLFWNEGRTKHILSQDFLRELLAKTPSEANIYLIIESCYSGIYLPLTNNNTFILTSANLTNPSYYKAAEVTAYFQYLSIFFMDAQAKSLLLFHAQAALLAKSYYPSDSLTAILDKRIYAEFNPALYTAKIAYDKINIRITSHPLYSWIPFNAVANYGFGFSVAILLILYPNNVLVNTLNLIFQCKMLVAFATMSATGLKFFAALLSQAMFNNLYKRFAQSNFYQSYPVFWDKILNATLQKSLKLLLDAMPKTPNATMLYGAKKSEMLLGILGRLHEISTSKQLTTPVHSPYLYLLAKMTLFLLVSMANDKKNFHEFDELICIATKLLFVNEARGLKECALLVENKLHAAFKINDLCDKKVRELIQKLVDTKTDEKDLYLIFIAALLKEINDKQQNLLPNPVGLSNLGLFCPKPVLPDTIKNKQASMLNPKP